MKTRILTLQYSLFFKDLVKRPDIEFSSINETMLNLFDAIPQILPVPLELPPEIPIIVHRSEKKEYSCNISRSRIDLLFGRVDDEKSNAEILKDFNSKANAFSKYVLKNQEVNRFGMVALYFFSDKDAVSTLRKKYFSKNIPDVSELSLKFNKKTKYKKYEINDLIEISSGSVRFLNNSAEGISLQRDINNTVEQHTNINFEELEEISSTFSSKITELQMEELIK